MALSVFSILLILTGWLLLGAGAFILALSHVRKGASWRAVFEQELERGRWSADDERRALVLRRFARYFLLGGVLAAAAGYVLRALQ